MIIDFTENGDLNNDTENFEELKRGVVIFPETTEEVPIIEKLKTFLESTRLTKTKKGS